MKFDKTQINYRKSGIFMLSMRFPLAAASVVLVLLGTCIAWEPVRWAMLIFLFLCHASQLNPKFPSLQPLVHLSDLPTYHFNQHFDSNIPHKQPTDLGGNRTALLPHTVCSHYSTCIKCSDNGEPAYKGFSLAPPACLTFSLFLSWLDLCTWCSAGMNDAPGHCIPTKDVQAQCLSLGGKTEECPFFTKSLVITTCILGVLITLAAGGGIGGGALFIPVLLLIYDLTAHQAVPLSKITIFGLAIGSYSVLYWKRHPTKDAPLIDYDFALLLVPGILLGTILGVYLNVIFPAFLIGVALSLLVSVTAVRTTRKGLKMLAKERAQQRDDGGDGRLTETIEMGSMGGGSASQPLLINDALQPILEREAAIPLRKFAVFGITWGGLVLLVLLKGGGHGPSMVGVRCGSVEFFLILLAAVPFLLGIAFLVGRRLLREHNEKCVAGYTFGEYDLQFDARSVLIIPLLGVGAGTAAGFLGIGAGLVVGPIMLELGLMPEVTQATASFTILFTASSTSLQFILLGKLPVRAAFWFFGLGFIMSIIGQYGVSYIIRKINKQYVIVFFLASMISLSAVFMTSNSIYHIAQDGFAGSFHNPCGNSI